MDKKTLLSYQPDYYKDSKVIDNINNALALEIERMRLNLINTLDQFCINTADTSLSRWEAEFGLDVANNYDTSYRRSKVLSRIRGQGTVNAALIKNVAESFENGTVEVIEDPANYSFTIKFVGTKGIPPNMDDLRDVIEELKPAHLAYTFEYTFTIWSVVEGQNITWDAAAAKTWDSLRTY